MVPTFDCSLVTLPMNLKKVAKQFDSDVCARRLVSSLQIVHNIFIIAKL